MLVNKGSLKGNDRSALLARLDGLIWRSSRLIGVLLSPKTPGWARWAIALLVTAAISLLEMALLGSMIEGALLPAVAVVIIAALIGGRGPGLVALVLNLVIAGYIVIPPYYTFVLPWPNGVISMAMFSLVAFIAWYAAVLFRDELAAVRERDELMATAAHDLRNPLNTLNLCLMQVQKLTNSGHHSDHENAAIYARIEKQVARMTRLVEDLLGASRTLAAERTQVDLAQLVRDVISEMAPEIEATQSKLVINLTQTEGTWNLLSLRRVVVNLITNALRYAPGSSIRVNLTKQQNFAVLEIADSGPGIDPSALPRILERYQRACRGGGPQGTGLGLYIVRQIVEAHGGKVSVHSSPGKGTRFVITLPLGLVPRSSAMQLVGISKSSAWTSHRL